MSFSYSFRDRPRLSDRIRGKSGDELFNELKKEFDHDRTSFFDRPSNLGSSAGSTFPRATHFFDDPLTRGHTDIRSHLEDLAQRHPEFADHLRYPAWTNEPTKTGTWGRKRRGSEETDTGEASKQQQQSQADTENKEAGSLRGRAKDNLRNTVPDMGQKQQQTEEKESRGQRSWSAPPPDNRAQENKPRFVSKIEINPVNPDAKSPQQQSSTSSGDATKPPMAPPKPQPQQQANQQQSAPQHKTSTVRHIPIFVEGRDEPLIPKAEPEFTQTQAPPQQHFTAPQQHFTPPQAHHFHPPRKQTPPRFEQSTQPRFEQVPVQTRYEKEVPIQTKFEKEVPLQSRYEQSQQHPPQPQPQPQPEQQQPQVNPNDPLYRVECVQKEVDELKTKIENFNGSSRKDKEYIYLDELLTRNLIKLDNIETEGREEVRAARKNTIKSIQRYINILENKVPFPNSESEGEKKEEGENVEGKVEAMEVEQQQNLESVVNQGGGDNQQNESGNFKLKETVTEQTSGEKPMEVEPQNTGEKSTEVENPKGHQETKETNSTSVEEKKDAANENKELSSNEASETKAA